MTIRIVTTLRKKEKNQKRDLVLRNVYLVLYLELSDHTS